jgi:propionyl-CoA carboxylase alpha chain
LDDKKVLMSTAFNIHLEKLKTQYSVEGKLEGFDANKSITDQMTQLVAKIYDEQYLMTVRSVDLIDEGGPVQYTLDVVRIEDRVHNTTASKDKKPHPKLLQPQGQSFEVSIYSDYQFGKLVTTANVNGNDNVLQVVTADDTGCAYRMQFLGTEYEVEIRTPREYELFLNCPELTKKDTSRLVVSPMPGAVYSLAVNVGDTVVPGQEVCVVEAMKMQNALRSQRNGKVKKIHVKVGQTVSTDDTLVEFE